MIIERLYSAYDTYNSEDVIHEDNYTKILLVLMSLCYLDMFFFVFLSFGRNKESVRR